MKKILYVILHTCTRPDRCNGIVNRWGKDVDYLFYSDCEDIEKKIIKVSDDKTYKSNEEKHVNIINHLIKNDFQYEWFFFCDDDTFVNTKKLENDLSNFNFTKINGCVLSGTWSQDKTLRYCSGGAGYLISNSLLKKFSNLTKIKSSGYSDVTLGIYAKEHNIEFENNDKFRSQKPNHYGLENHSVNDFYTFHYVLSEEMIKFFELLK